MSLREFAKEITGPALSDAAYAFRENPTADNWMLLERTMKAHQMASHASDDEIDLFLHDAPPSEVISSLLVLFDLKMISLESQLRAGQISLIKAFPEFSS